MSTSETSGLVTDMAGLRDHVGTHLGFTEWQVMDQERVNQFADVTDDHNYIHVDVERAKASPFGGTVAHGYLTLSLLAPVTMQLLRVTDVVAGVNYGLDRVRFPAPLPVGARVARRRRDRLGRRGPGWIAGQAAGHHRGQGIREAGHGRRVPGPAVRRRLSRGPWPPPPSTSIAWSRSTSTPTPSATATSPRTRSRSSCSRPPASTSAAVRPSPAPRTWPTTTASATCSRSCSTSTTRPAWAAGGWATTRSWRRRGPTPTS